MSDDSAKDAAALELAVGSLMAAVDIELDEASAASMALIWRQ